MLDLHCCAGFSLVAANGGYSLVVVLTLLIAVASRCGAWTLGYMGFGLVDVRYVGSSQPRD